MPPAVGSDPATAPASAPASAPEFASLRERARQHLDRDEYEDARRAASAAPTLVPTDAVAKRLLGQAHLALGEIDGAAQALGQGARLAPNDGEFHRLALL